MIQVVLARIATNSFQKKKRGGNGSCSLVMILLLLQRHQIINLDDTYYVQPTFDKYTMVALKHFCNCKYANGIPGRFLPLL